jgi:uncharacterized PurR-regulated membrane protein YhhQ (DUF165 family)
MSTPTYPRRAAGMALAAAYIGTIVLANALIAALGVVPVGFGLMAPAGVYAAGLAFTLRDGVQETLGPAWTVAAILAGAALSAALGAQLALASGAAFLVSELADYAVYSPLRRRSWLGAVALSNTVGAVLDSAIFLTLAFGSLDFLAGQVWGKSIVTLGTVAILSVWRARRRVTA